MSDFQATRVMLITALNAAFAGFGENGIEFQSGELGGPSPNIDLGCVFKNRDQPDTRDTNMGQQYFVVRVLLRDVSSQQPAPEYALDPTPLEDAAELVVTTVRDVQALPDGYITWIRTDYHTDARVVDALFHTWETSPFNIGG